MLTKKEFDILAVAEQCQRERLPAAQLSCERFEHLGA